MQAAIKSFRIWAEMVKLSHTVFALPFALIATFLAGRELEGRTAPFPGQLVLIVLCMVAARSTAMTFNRIVDAQIDARNPRTAGRPLPAGRLSTPAAYVMLILSIVSFGLGCLGFHVFYANTWPILLGGPVLAYLCAYSLTKRFTRWSHFVLGSAIAISPAAAWIAIDPLSLGLPALLLMITVTCWIGGFDIIYACQDIDVDRREGLHSLPSRLGPARALWVARLAHAAAIAALIALGVVSNLGAVYAVGVGAAALLLIIEHSLVRADDYRHVNLAFFTLNGIVSVVLAGAAISDLFV
jgi:4-hydroxybenzoate polyprenyltransferase